MGNVNVFESRRTMFERCLWWKQSTFGGSVPLSAKAYEKEPSGSFYAKEIQDVSESMAGADIKYTQRVTAIQTYDDVYGKIFENDLVSYDGRIWKVASVSMKREWKRSQFSKRNGYGAKVIVLRS